MNYFELYHFLKGKANFHEREIKIDNLLNWYNQPFCSDSHNILGGLEKYNCQTHQIDFDSYTHNESTLTHTNPTLDVDDAHLKENNEFNYHIFKPANAEKAKEVILLFHGFNEKYWFKYLPWAYSLQKKTGKTIILFPIAFHMNRAPHDWSDMKKMYEVSMNRKKEFPDIINCSMSNVAISSRLHAKPQRFFWSGLQTYNDIMQLIAQIRKGEHQLIDSTATFDIFSYSIGSLLAQILMMTNQNNEFEKSKSYMFCGGAVFNRMSPVSKFIIDSEASVAMYSHIIEHIDSHLAHNKRLQHYLKQHPEGIYFFSMLDYRKLKVHRENRLREIASRMKGLTLEKDSIIPSYEIISTLRGADHSIPISVDVFDFPYPYKHEEPFPATEKNAQLIDEQFTRFIDHASEFLA